MFKKIFSSPWLPIILAALLWVYSLPAIDVREMKDWGLVSVFPLSIMVAYLVITAGFASLFMRKQVRQEVYAGYVLLTILMIHGTPQLLYGTLRYSWAWKHVGIVDYIIRNGGVDPAIDILGVYHNWPGFFTFNALFVQLADFSSALAYAGWAPVFFEILFALGLLSLFKLFTPNHRLQWLGIWFFLLANWIGQDYFSPQAMNFFLLIGVLFLVLYGSGSFQSRIQEKVRKVLTNPRVTQFLGGVSRQITALDIARITKSDESGEVRHRILGGIVLVVFIAIVSSHQLTPLMGLVAVTGLTIFGYSRWRLLPLWMSLCVAFWILFPARVYNHEIVESIIESFGKVTDNIDSGLVNLAEVSAGQVVVSWMGRGLTVGMGMLATIGTYRRLVRRHFDFPILLLAAAPFFILFMNSYGGEVIFRVYFFALPFLSFLAARALMPDDQTLMKWRHTVVIAATSLVMLTAMLFAYYGKDQQYYFTKGEAEAAEFVYSRAEPNSLLVEGARNYPSQFLNYEYFTYVPIDREPLDSKERLLNDPVGVLSEWLSNPDYAESYLIITRSQKAYTDALGVFPPGALDEVQKSLEASEQFEVLFSNQDAVVFVVREEE